MILSSSGVGRDPESYRCFLFFQVDTDDRLQGIIATTLLVPAQISVPHAQMPQVTALFVCFSFVGSSIGSCIAGGIYTNSFRPALWIRLGDDATTEMVDSLFNSITGTLPLWGSPERDAINAAVGFLTLAGLHPGINMCPCWPDITDTSTVFGRDSLHDLCCSWCFDTWTLDGNFIARLRPSVSLLGAFVTWHLEAKPVD